MVVLDTEAVKVPAAVVERVLVAAVQAVAEVEVALLAMEREGTAADKVVRVIKAAMVDPETA